jgi:hypothetical protein
MTKKKLAWGMLAIALTFGMTAFGCKTEEEDKAQPQGKLTVTGLASYNGKYILAQTQGTPLLMGAASLNSQTPKGVLISGGQAVLPMDTYTQSGAASYTGNDQAVEINLAIFSTETPGETPDQTTSVTANFTSGNATVAWQ